MPDCRDADFTDIQSAINALPPNGGKVFVKAGSYVISQTIRVQQSNVHIQGEGMGITNIVTASTMTAEAISLAFRTAALGPSADTTKSGIPI